MAELAVPFSRQILKGSQDLFFYFINLIFIYFFRYETRSRAWSFGHSDPDPSSVSYFLCQSISNCLEYLVSITLAVGMGISMVLLLMEHFYMRYLQTHVQKTTDNGCCALISQVSKGQLISDHILLAFKELECYILYL